MLLQHSNTCHSVPPPPPQMRKLHEKIAELQAEHAAQIEAVTAQYGALLQQVRLAGCLLLGCSDCSTPSVPWVQWSWTPSSTSVVSAAAAGSGRWLVGRTRGCLPFTLALLQLRHQHILDR